MLLWLISCSLARLPWLAIGSPWGFLIDMVFSVEKLTPNIDDCTQSVQLTCQSGQLLSVVNYNMYRLGSRWVECFFGLLILFRFFSENLISFLG